VTIQDGVLTNLFAITWLVWNVCLALMLVVDGADGYKDVRVVLKSNNKEVNDVKVTGAADKAERMLSFSVTSSAKTAK